jgi:catechol 2,3-dioxygenase-like lactoylglutathione lyase family enzyme
VTLHGLIQIVVGVPNVDETADYYEEFGLTPAGLAGRARTLATVDGGEQLVLTGRTRRRLLELHIGADDRDDIDRIVSNLSGMGIPAQRTDDSVTAHDAGTDVTVTVAVASRVVQPDMAPPAYNGPGHLARRNQRAPGVERTTRVKPRRLGHVVLGSTDEPQSQRFLTDGIGFRISDTVPGLAAFLRCSTDHHNVLVQQAPVAFLHHSSWQVEDVDEVGRGATAMLEKDPARHVWGLGRHHVGSNFFWYLRDPAGNFSEYYSDLDCIVDDALWQPQTWAGMHGLYNWGPPPPPSFLAPDDLAALMTGAHSA